MKWNIFLTIICILLSALDAYWIYNLAAEHEYALAITIESGICFATSLVPLIALDYVLASTFEWPQDSVL